MTFKKRIIATIFLCSIASCTPHEQKSTDLIGNVYRFHSFSCHDKLRTGMGLQILALAMNNLKNISFTKDSVYFYLVDNKIIKEHAIYVGKEIKAKTFNMKLLQSDTFETISLLTETKDTLKLKRVIE